MTRDELLEYLGSTIEPLGPGGGGGYVRAVHDVDGERPVLGDPERAQPGRC